MPVTPMAAAVSSVRWYAAGEVPSLPTTVTRREYAANHSRSKTTVSRTGSASAISARVLSQPWCPSPLIRITGVSGATASSSATVGSRSQRESR